MPIDSDEEEEMKNYEKREKFQIEPASTKEWIENSSITTTSDK